MSFSTFYFIIFFFLQKKFFKINNNKIKTIINEKEQKPKTNRDSKKLLFLMCLNIYLSY